MSYSLQQLRTNPSVVATLQPLTIILKQKPPVFQKTMTTFNGGTGMTAFNDGDIFIGNNSTLATLPIGNIDQVLNITNVGGVDWTDSMLTAKQKMINYDLVNKYSSFQSQALTLKQDYAAKGVSIFTIEQDTGFVAKSADTTVQKISSNQTKLDQSNSIITQLQSVTNTAQANIANIYSELAAIDSTITNLDSNLTTQLSNVQTLFTGVGNLQSQISNVYSNITSDITFKNLIVNGDFQIWQRSTFFSGPNTNASYITADHWYHSRDTNGTVTSQKSSSTVNNRVTNTLLLSLSGANNGLSLMTTVENATVLQNSFATLSFYVRCPTTQTLTITVVQNFGNGGSTPITLTTSTCVTTNSWTRWSNTFNVPDIGDYYIGPNSYIQVIIKTGTSFTNLEFAFVQLEANISATNFTSRQYQIEELLCKRYYEEGYSTFAGRATASLGVSVTHSYSVTKYETPSITTAIVNNTGFNNTATAGFMNDINNGSVKVTKDSTSGYGNVTIKYQAEAEII
jgi:hypothetical protein